MKGSADIGEGATVRRVETLAFQRLDDELIAIDADRGLCFSLNETAARVWEGMAQPITVADLCIRARAGYDVAEAACLADVRELLGEMRAAGLVEIADA